MPRRREFTPSQRREIVERSKRNGVTCCERCGLALGAKPYEVDHIIAEALRPEADKARKLTIAEGQLLGKDCCHRGEDGKTNDDIGKIAEANRRFDRANGLSQRIVDAPKMPSRGFSTQSRKSADRKAKAEQKLPMPPRRHIGTGVVIEGERG